MHDVSAVFVFAVNVDAVVDEKLNNVDQIVFWILDNQFEKCVFSVRVFNIQVDFLCYKIANNVDEIFSMIRFPIG